MFCVDLLGSYIRVITAEQANTDSGSYPVVFETSAPGTWLQS